MSTLFSVGEGNFVEQVLQSSQPVLVDFTATWCGPCKMLAPIVEQLAAEWQGKVRVVQLDVDDNPGLAADYQVMGVPTLILFVAGKPRHRMTGYKPKDKVQKEFLPHLT